MILIADSGATKTSWRMIDADGITSFSTEGYHPFYVDADYISRSLTNNLPVFIRDQNLSFSEIHFYSTGAGFSSKADNVLTQGVTRVLKCSSFILETDLLAAGRALFQDETGLATILGTGSNSGLYNGKEITNSIESGGFLLGDEGSGSYLGKLLITAYLRNQLPDNLHSDFTQTYNLNAKQLISQVYSVRSPNQFCAKFATFVGNHMDDKFCKELAFINFDHFFKKIISQYSDYKNFKINAVGSVVYNLRETFEAVAESHALKVGKILSSVMDGILNYHQFHKVK